MEEFLVERVTQSLALHCAANATFLCERLCAAAPTESNLHLLATCYLRAGKPQQAYHTLQELTAPCSRYLRGVTCMQLRMYQESEAALASLVPPLPSHMEGGAGGEQPRKGLNGERGRGGEKPGSDAGQADVGSSQEQWTDGAWEGEGNDDEGSSGEQSGRVQPHYGTKLFVAPSYYLLGLICRLTDRKQAAVRYLRLSLAADPFLWSAYEELCVLGAAAEVSNALSDAVVDGVRRQYEHRWQLWQKHQGLKRRMKKKDARERGRTRGQRERAQAQQKQATATRQAPWRQAGGLLERGGDGGAAAVGGTHGNGAGARRAAAGAGPTSDAHALRGALSGATQQQMAPHRQHQPSASESGDATAAPPPGQAGGGGAALNVTPRTPPAATSAAATAAAGAAAAAAAPAVSAVHRRKFVDEGKLRKVSGKLFHEPTSLRRSSRLAEGGGAATSAAAERDHKDRGRHGGAAATLSSSIGQHPRQHASRATDAAEAGTGEGANARRMHAEGQGPAETSGTHDAAQGQSTAHGDQATVRRLDTDAAESCGSLAQGRGRSAGALGAGRRPSAAARPGDRHGAEEGVEEDEEDVEEYDEDNGEGEQDDDGAASGGDDSGPEEDEEEDGEGDSEDGHEVLSPLPFSRRKGAAKKSAAAVEPAAAAAAAGAAEAGVLAASGREGLPCAPSGPAEVLSLLQTLGKGYLKVCLLRGQEAAELLQQLPPDQFKTAWVLCQVGRLHTDRVEYAEAQRAFSWARQLSPCRVEHLDVFSTVLYHLKEDMQLSYLAQEALAIDRLAPQPWCVVGNLMSLSKQHDSALKFFRRALQLDPFFTYAHTLCGHEHMFLEEFDEAAACYRAALRLDSRHYNAWFGLGTVYMRQERFDMAEHHLRRAIALNPHSSVLHCYLGVALHSLSRNAEAHAALERAVRLSPANPLPRFHSAHVLLAEERLDDALAAATELLHVAPHEPSLFFLLGKIYKKMEQPEKAVLHLNMALDLKPPPQEVNLIKAFIEKLNVHDSLEEDEGEEDEDEDDGDAVDGDDEEEGGVDEDEAQEGDGGDEEDEDDEDEYDGDRATDE